MNNALIGSTEREAGDAVRGDVRLELIDHAQDLGIRETRLVRVRGRNVVIRGADGLRGRQAAHR